MSSVEDRILDAAVEAASVHGIGRMSVGDVAKRAGLSRPTVYKRFASKDELVRATVEREVRTIVGRVMEAVDGLTEPREMLATGLLTALRLAREHPLLDRVVRTEPELLVPLLTTDDALIMSAVRQPVEVMVAATLPHLDAVVSRRASDVLVRLLISYSLSAPDDPPEIVADVVADLFTRGALAMTSRDPVAERRRGR
jgi:AcrR family transcriptional regulator